MAAGTYNWSVEQGSKEVRTMTWKDSGGTGIDITGYLIRMMVRKGEEDEDTILSLDSDAIGGIVLTTPGSGIFTVTITATQTAALPDGAWVYDLEMDDQAGDVTRLIEGTFTVDREITR
jgi:hypothetical protein